MGVDCDSVSGFGIRLTDEIVQKMIDSGLFTREEWEEDPQHYLNKTPFHYEVAGSYYTGDVYYYLFASGDTIPALLRGANKLIMDLEDIGVTLQIEDIKHISDTLWS